MSYYNDYMVASNNSINENKLNAKKARSNNNNNTIHQLKKLIKPLLTILKNKQNKSTTYKKQPQPEYYKDEEYCSEIDENLANEILENQLFEEIDNCEDFSGVPVYNNGHMDIMPIFRGQRFIPVHFARTEAGTFFWTTMMGADCDVDCKNETTTNQMAELQTPNDRWAQA